VEHLLEIPNNFPVYNLLTIHPKQDRIHNSQEQQLQYQYHIIFKQTFPNYD